jgi:mRNA-degrading endonuclease RelE of RelBE toxin-antitoxin system
MPARDRNRVNRALNDMKNDPLGGDITPLRGEYQGTFRRRVGSWRILFSVRSEIQTVISHDIRRRTSTTCPVCKSQLSAPTVAAPHTLTFTLNCPRCGSYLVGDQALRLLRDEFGRQRLRWAITSHAIRRMHSPGSAPHQVTPEWLQSAWAHEKSPSPQEQADTFIEYLGAADVALGNLVRCNPQHLTGLIGTADDPTLGKPR